MTGGSNQLVTAEAAAQYLGVSKANLLRNRGEWGVKSVRVGQRVMFRVRDLDAYISGAEE